MAVLSKSEKIGIYTVQSLIKANHYTETYRVVDSNNQPFFLKVFILNNLPAKLMNRETNCVREIEYCRQLNHRNIVSHVADGKLERESGSYQYYLTNYFSGPVLADYLRTNGPLNEEDAFRVFRAIIVGIQHMHAQETPLCHNDLTPANIVLNDAMGSEAVIIDLGHTSTPCAGIVEFDTNDLDIHYQAKETMVGIFDQQTDIFSACAVLYTMLTGRTPWQVAIPSEGDYKERFKVMWLHRQTVSPEIPEGISAKVKAIITVGMAQKASDRFKSIDDVLAIVDDQKPVGDTNSVKRPEINKESSESGGRGEGSENIDGDDDLPVEIRRGGGNGFADIAGMQELKDYMTQKVIFMIQNKEIAEQYRITPPNGMLLYGPPGCGKTFFAEKFAEETNFNFMLVKSSDIGSSLVHGTEAKIQKLFAKAEKNSPIVICFDEFDALVPVRGAHGSEYQSGEVNEFLAQMNNCAKKGIFIIATSNRPDKIDPAILRTGRIDKQVFVPLPDFEARKEMFRMYLEKRPTSEDVNIEDYAQKTEGYIASDIAFIVNDAAMTAAYTRKPISHELMCTSLGNIKPSLQKEVIDEYSQIRNKMNNVQRRAVIQSL